jgi:glycosyltransferase involved in cell wall biosynthesis
MSDSGLSDHGLGDTLSILTATTLFPNTVQPSHGIFVETRLRKLVQSGQVRAEVLAPVAYVPPLIRYAGGDKLRDIPAIEQRNDLTVYHPRYLVVPKFGMNLAPHTLYRAMRRALRERLAAGARFNLIDAHYFYPDGVAAAWLGQEFGLPVVITARGTDINLIPQFSKPRRRILEAVNTAAASITVCQALKDEMIELGASADKITVLRNGVDLERFRLLDRDAMRAKWDVKGFTLVSVGLLIERKGHHLAIEALTGLADVTLLIAGAGPELASLQQLAHRLGVAERVRFLGSLDQPRLCEVYNAADICVLASSREGWANVLLEAMASGTPVVASAVWGTPEVVAAPEAGLLLEERGAPAIVKAVTALRQAMPERARTRAYAEQFDWQPTTQGQLDIFRRAIADYPKSAA